MDSGIFIKAYIKLVTLMHLLEIQDRNFRL